MLEASEPEEKVARALETARAWAAGELGTEEDAPAPPDRPGRPDRPQLLPPAEMPKRSARGKAGRVAMLHAVAHIEFNAIDLAWDHVARFGNQVGERGYLDDWVRIGGEEAMHFGLVRQRLRDLGADYGDLPAHDGLWEAAQDTADDPLARLAIVPLVLEARGLDVNPQMAARFRSAADPESAAILDIILADEVGHVAAGVRWFKSLCAKMDLEPVATFQKLVQERFKGGLKPPFNEPARAKAGLLPEFYLNLSSSAPNLR